MFERRTWYGRIVAAAMMLTVGMVCADGSKPVSVEGVWQGVLGGALRLTLNLSKGADGTLQATLVSVDQGGQKLPAQVSFKDHDLHLAVSSVHGEYAGKLNQAGTEIAGTWSQAGQSQPLNFKRGADAPTARRPQEPKKPYPYREEEVSYENAAAGIRLGGTLTMPKGPGPFPAVLLITGSGAQDRNEALLGHKPFLVLADYLTRRGLAVLRVDDRGVGASSGDFSTATSADFASDALAGVNFLKARSDIRRDRIGLIGHSEGGMIAPMVAVQSSDVAFIVLMAGPGVSGEEILTEQQRLILEADGAPAAQVAANDASLKKSFAVLRQEPDAAKAQPRLMQISTEYIATLPGGQRVAAQKDLKETIDQFNSPWMRYFLRHDPAATLQRVACPVLAINGELDLQVPPKQNLPPMEAALKAGKNRDYTLRELPKLNHLFQSATTGSPSEYAQIEETINPAALELMGDWIAARISGKE